MRFAFTLLAAVLLASSGAAESHKTKKIVLVTADGLRWQELFSGIDAALMKEKAAGMDKAGALTGRLWKESAEQRRELLMPFVWTEFARQGMIFGNPQRNSKVQVSNSIRVSYPGYSEILTGRSQDAVIRGNDKIQNPTETVLEFVRKKKGLSRAQVALFASWDTFPFIGESQPGSVYINAGYQPVERTGSSARLRELGNLQSRIMTPWDSVRHDYFTFELAQEYLRSVKPSLLYLSLGETDDWAHDRRYDRVLTTVAYFDECLKNLWTTLQSLPEYRGVTTMIVTSDHGRGSTLQDWHGHGKTVEGADQIWLAIMGPDTPAGGEMHDTPAIFQRDVAPTILDLLDIGYQEYSGVEGHPISLATSGRK